MKHLVSSQESVTLKPTFFTEAAKWGRENEIKVTLEL